MKRLYALLALVCGSISPLDSASRSAVVTAPIADVWDRPLPSGTTGLDAWRETQVLFGEHVRIHESSGPWVRIEAVEQPEFTHHNRWEGYPGWLLGSWVSPGPQRSRSQPAWLETLKIPDSRVVSQREKVLYAAAQFLGVPYRWGGLSKQGVDCSGLVHLVFRVQHQVVPRDSNEQWMKAKPIQRADLRPGDLIFSAKTESPKKIVHVMIFAGYLPPHPTLSPKGERAIVDGLIYEAPQEGVAVRKISFKEKYGKNLSEVESGRTVGDRVLYFGSFIP